MILLLIIVALVVVSGLDGKTLGDTWHVEGQFQRVTLSALLRDQNLEHDILTIF